ncbi:MAG: MotA/TolQ/ExbB proton channel family protein, partial [Desulfatibacillaceae bacterium]|nr:MotA/TolQ/ExbB proton channel family protein [Desulfatibacillaceae bacterium]
MIVSDTEVIRLILNAGPMVRMVLLVLLGFSIACWAIIFTKIIQLRTARRQNALFLDSLWRTGDLAKSFAQAKKMRDAPMARAFRMAYLELTRQMGPNQPEGEGNAYAAQNLQGAGFGLRLTVERTLRRATQMEISRLSQFVPFLATAGNTAPFIGLFGTVWGIMNAFHGIGLRGSATLSVVAPGISEALVATAAGLAAAIPAVIAFNHF